MNAADALRIFLEPLLPGWRIQQGEWVDGSPTDRFAVLKGAGGLPASLTRHPHFTLTLIGAKDEGVSIASSAADEVVQATRESSGTLVLIQASEPIGPTRTTDGRPVFEIAIATITT